MAAGRITTSWVAPSQSAGTFTDKNPGESTDDWIDRHFDGILGAPPIDLTTLTTTWICNGAAKSKQSTRNAGETYRAFLARHEQEATDEMDDCPPE